MVDINNIVKEIVKDILTEGSPDVGPCFFVGVFKPPHKGDFDAAKYLASQNYINRVYIVISNVPKFGINAQDSLYIWNEYLKAEPNPKIKVMISSESSPVKDIYSFLKNNPNVTPVYVAAAEEELEDGGFGSLTTNFPDRVRIETIPDEYTKISATQMRTAVEVGDYEDVAKFVPDAAYNKGVAKDVFARLIKVMK